jgi:hypothetical protein
MIGSAVHDRRMGGSYRTSSVIEIEADSPDA